MKNLKKLLAVLVVVTLLATSMMPAFAASYTYSTQAQKLYDLGLYKGSSATGFEPDLGSALDRQQGVVMLIRLLGKEPAALALTSSEVNATLIIFSDADKLASWAKKHIAYAVLYKYVAGLPNGTFAPNNPLTGKEFCTMLLRALGYTVDAAGYAGACYQLSNIGGITFAEAAKFNEKELIRDDMVGIAYGVLNANYKTTGKSVIQTMVESKVVTEAQAISAGVYDNKLEADAKAAIAAYKAGAISTLDEIAAVEAKKAAADAAVAKIVVEATKTALQKEIDARAKEVADARAAIEKADADEKAAIAAAEEAVKAYETASIATDADVAAAEALGKAAEEKAEVVKTEASKESFLARIDAREEVVAARKADLAVIADATAAVNKYVAAAYDTLAKIEAAEKLEAEATTIINKIVDKDAAAALNKKVADQKAIIAAMKAKLSPVKIANVDTTSLRVLRVTFDKAINNDSITTDTLKLSVNNSSMGYKKYLSADGKVLTLVYANPINQNDVVKLEINDIADSVGFKSGKIEGAYIAKDIIDPAVVSFNVLSNKKIKLFFNEPVNMETEPNADGTNQYRTTDVTNSKVSLKVNNNYSFASYKAIPEENAVLVTFFSPLPNGEVAISLSEVKDFAGFKIAEYNFTVNISQDKTPPKPVAAKADSVTEIVVEFDEPITHVPGVATFVVKETGNTTAKEIAGTASALEGKGIKITLKDTTPLTAAAIIGFTVEILGVQDDAGNSITTATTIVGQLVDDTTPPSVLSWQLLSDNKLEIVFSKPVNITNARADLFEQGKTNVLATYSTGSIAASTTSGKANAYVIDLSAYLAGKDAKNYEIALYNITDNSVRNNPLVVGKLAFSAKDTKLPTVLYAAILPGNTTGPEDDKIEIAFSEAMNQAALSNLSNYFVLEGKDIPDPNDNTKTIRVYDINTAKAVSMITNAKIHTVSSDYKKVVLSVPGAYTSSYEYVAALGMSDATGNMLSNIGSSLTNPMVATKGYDPFNSADIQANAQVISPTQIKILLVSSSNNLFGYVDSNAFVFKDSKGNNVTAKLGIVAAQIAADGKSVTLTSSVAFNAYGKFEVEKGVYDTLTIELFKDVNEAYPYIVRDINGTQLQLTTPIGTEDKIKATQTGLEVYNDRIEFVFDETIKFASGINADIMAGALEIKGVNKSGGTTTTLIPGTHYTVSINSNKLVATLTTSGKNLLAVDTSTNKAMITSALIKRADYLNDSNENGVTVK